MLFLTTLPAVKEVPIEATVLKFAGGSTFITFITRLVAKDIAETIGFFRREIFHKEIK